MSGIAGRMRRVWGGMPFNGAVLALAIAAPAAAETVRCEPMWPKFCRNVHIACAGRTRIPTQAFTVEFRDAEAEVVFADGARAMVGVTGTGGDRVLRPSEGRDWIRIDATGRFSQRIHRGATSVMSTGPCLVEAK